ncbi:MAG: efflux RND transporter permease subunit, partial [Candidatus Falkowbacteria bacterium]|nr:efflux RND transporter permease subunit [Candidatus Falkowbacteria bacterium]
LSSRLMHGIVKFDKIIILYEKYLNIVLASKQSRRNTLLAVFATFIIAISLPISGILQSEFFPKSDFDYMWVNVEAPIGLNLSETNKITAQAEEKLLKYSDIINFSTLVGSGGSGGSRLSGGSFSSPSNSASITVKLKDKSERRVKSYDLAETIRGDMKDIKDAKVTVELQQSGPPSGAAFELRIAGDDLQTLDKIANDLKVFLDSIKGTVNSSISMKDSPADYTFTLDPARLELYNLNAAYVGSSLRMAISGTEITSILRDGKKIKVIARFEKERIPNLEAIQNIQILNLKKQPVFLKDVAKIELKPSVNEITRVDQKRVVILSSSVDKITNPNNVISEFQSEVANNYKIPAGYELIFGGQNETNTESVTSILRAMVIAALLIISTLIIQFNSFRQSLIVLTTIPLALIGVFFGLTIAGVNLSFPG